MRFLPILSASLAGCLTLSAEAAPVTYFFNGSLTTVQAPLSAAFSVGDKFAGSFTVNGSDTDPSPDRAFYSGGPVFSADVAGHAFFNPGGVVGSTVVENNVSGFDNFVVNGGLFGFSPPGFTAGDFFFILQDSNAVALTSDALIPSFPLALFGTKELGLAFLDSSGIAFIDGNLSYLSTTDPSITANPSIPEPASLPLVGIALAALGTLSMRQRRVA